MAADEDSPRIVAPPPVIFLVEIAVGFLLQLFVLPLSFFGFVFFLPIGLAMAVLSGAVAFWAMSTFKVVGTNINPAKPVTKIVTSGPFRFTRNPMYLALVLLQIGLGLSFANAWLLILLVPFMVVMRFGVIRPEESYLEKKFGEPYRDYKTAVRRWI
jgi:protein-S-isoprenylcysteine O-methyltransferase Ste14